MGICEGRVCIVTGAGRGIGREHSLLLASQGAKVVVNDLGGEMDGGGRATAGPAQDVVDEIVAAGGEGRPCLAGWQTRGPNSGQAWFEALLVTRGSRLS